MRQKRLFCLCVAGLFAFATLNVASAQEPAMAPPVPGPHAAPVVHAAPIAAPCNCAAVQVPAPCQCFAPRYAPGCVTPWAAPYACPPAAYPYYAYPYYPAPVVYRAPLFSRIFRPAVVAPYPYWGGYPYGYGYGGYCW